ncbi:MAG: hypothetical protein IKH12_01570 [Clostridia bacterium]|nr:hypothetical protein [Clostridia bacterium]
MKPWRIVKTVLSALWLAVTLTGLIYWFVTLAYPWNGTNLWLVPLYLAFPVWAFVGAVLGQERPLLYRICKTFVIVLALLPAIGVALIGIVNAASDGSSDDLFVYYRLGSETSNPSAYGKWDEACANDLFPKEIPANAEDVSFSYRQVGILTQFWQDDEVTLKFRLKESDFNALRAAIRARYPKESDIPETDGEEVYADWKSLSGFLQVTFNAEDNCVRYELFQPSFGD